MGDPCLYICVSVAGESSDGTMFLHAEGPAQLLMMGGPCDGLMRVWQVRAVVGPCSYMPKALHNC